MRGIVGTLFEKSKNKIIPRGKIIPGGIYDELEAEELMDRKINEGFESFDLTPKTEDGKPMNINTPHYYNEEAQHRQGGKIHIFRFAGKNNSQGGLYKLSESYVVLEVGKIVENVAKVSNKLKELLKDKTPLCSFFEETGIKVEKAADAWINEIKKLYILAILEVAKEPKLELNADTIEKVLFKTIDKLKLDKLENPKFIDYSSKIPGTLKSMVEEISKHETVDKLSKGVFLLNGVYFADNATLGYDFNKGEVVKANHDDNNNKIADEILDGFRYPLSKEIYKITV